MGKNSGNPRSYRDGKLRALFKSGTDPNMLRKTLFDCGAHAATLSPRNPVYVELSVPPGQEDTALAQLRDCGLCEFVERMRPPKR